MAAFVGMNVAGMSVARVAHAGHEESRTPPTTNVYCSHERLSHPLTLATHQGRWVLHQFSFKVSPFLSEALACEQWLLDVQTQPLFQEANIGFRPVLGQPGRKPEAVLINETGEYLLEACQRSLLCALRPIDRASLWYVKSVARDLWHGNPAPPPAGAAPERLSSARCQEKPLRDSSHPGHLPAAGAVAHAPLPIVHSIQRPTFWFTPLTTLTDEALRQIPAAGATEGSSLLVLSAMTLADTEFERLVKAAAGSPETLILVLVDLPTAMLSRNSSFFQSDKPANLVFAPMFNSPARTGNYHVKGAALTGPHPAFVFSSANLSGSELESLTFDLGFTAADPRLARAFSKLVLDQALAQCEEPEYLECNLAAAFPPNAVEPHRIRQLFQESCGRLKGDARVERVVTDNSPSPILSSADSGMRQILLDHLRASRNSVWGVSHRISDRAVWSLARHGALLEGRRGGHAWSSRTAGAVTRKSGRGDSVQESGADPNSSQAASWDSEVSSAQLEDQRESELAEEQPERTGEEGQTPKTENSKDPLFSGDHGELPAHTRLEAHSKAVLVDDRMLLIGTGNFTQLGLEEPGEYFLMTDAPEILTAFREYMTSVSWIYDRDPESPLPQVQRVAAAAATPGATATGATVAMTPVANGMSAPEENFPAPAPAAGRPTSARPAESSAWRAGTSVVWDPALAGRSRVISEGKPALGRADGSDRTPSPGFEKAARGARGLLGGGGGGAGLRRPPPATLLKLPPLRGYEKVTDGCC